MGFSSLVVLYNSIQSAFNLFTFIEDVADVIIEDVADVIIEDVADLENNSSHKSSYSLEKSLIALFFNLSNFLSQRALKIIQTKGQKFAIR